MIAAFLFIIVALIHAIRFFRFCDQQFVNLYALSYISTILLLLGKS